MGILLLLDAFGPLIISEGWYLLKEIKHQQYSLQAKNGVTDSVFARFLSSDPVLIKPVNTDFAIVIEKLDVNAPIVQNVNVSDPQAYAEALKYGVAHASISDYPSDQPGNVYLFAHSSLNFWQLGKYATVFNLLGKLTTGDRINVFYKGKDYVYAVVNMEVYPGWNTYPLTRPVLEPILTLQTCDPPGTTLNRLVVTARLIGVY
jgi:sortase A